MAYDGFYAGVLRGGPAGSVGNSEVFLNVTFAILLFEQYCDSGQPVRLQYLQIFTAFEGARRRRFACYAPYFRCRAFSAAPGCVVP